MYFQPIILEGSKNTSIEEILKFLDSININVNDVKLNEILSIKLKESKQSIGIEEVERFVEWSYFKSEKLRVSIIFDAERLTPEAQNSLLKVLEEPSNNALIVLLLNNVNSLLNTIQSRAKSYRMNNIDYKGNVFNVQELLKQELQDREKYFNKFEDNDNLRGQINEFILELIRYFMSLETRKNYLNMIELLRICNKANRNKVNSKMILDTININLELLNLQKK